MKWYKRDPDAFKGGTIGLSLEEVGAYTLLLDDIYARNGAIPDDELYCCRLLRCDPRVWRRVRARLIVAGKIQTTGVLLSNFRATSEISSANVRLMLAQRLNEKRWKNKADSHPTTEDTTTTTTTSREEKKEYIGRSQATRPNHEKHFEDFWKAYPKRKGANPKAPARKAFFAFLKAGSDPVAIMAGARNCAAIESDKIGTEFIPQAIKWLRDRRWEDYADAVDTEKIVNGWQPGMRTNEEILAEMGAKNATQPTAKNGNGISPSSCGVHAKPSEARKCELSDDKSRNAGMGQLGKLFQRISRV